MKLLMLLVLEKVLTPQGAVHDRGKKTLQLLRRLKVTMEYGRAKHTRYRNMCCPWVQEDTALSGDSEA